MSDTRNSPLVDAALAAKYDAEAENFRAETAKAVEEARIFRLNADGAALHFEKDQLCMDEFRLSHARAMARDEFNHLIRFTEPVTSASVERTMDELAIMSRTNPGCDIEIVFNSPGGSVIAGLDLYDYLQELRRKGHHITTATRGYAASMGGILLQAGDYRVMGKEAFVLIHEVSSIALGKIGEIEDEMVFIRKIQQRVLDIFAARSAEALRNGTSAVALTADQFNEGDRSLDVPGWRRRDWWLDSDECLRYGIVDAVR